MDKEAIRVQIASHKNIVEFYTTTLEKHQRLLAALEAELTETEKPELRNMTYGKNCNGLPFVISRDMLMWVEPTGQRETPLKGNDTMVKAVLFGNLKDDLEAIAEPLTAFKTDVHHYRIESEDYPDAPIYMAGNHHPVAEVEVHIGKLRRLVATYKRGQNEKAS